MAGQQPQALSRTVQNFSPGRDGLCGLLVASQAALVDEKRAILERVDPKSSAIFDRLANELNAAGDRGVFASARPA